MIPGQGMKPAFCSEKVREGIRCVEASTNLRPREESKAFTSAFFVGEIYEGNDLR